MSHACEHFARSSCILCIDVDDVFAILFRSDFQTKVQRSKKTKTRDIMNPFLVIPLKCLFLALAAHRHLVLVPSTSIFQWLFQLDDFIFLHKKWLIHHSHPFKTGCLGMFRQVYRVILDIKLGNLCSWVRFGRCQTIPRYRLLRGLEFNNFFSEATALKERSQRKSWWQRYGPLVF